MIGNKQIVILDTSPVRNLAYAATIPRWARIFSKMKKEGYLFSLSECTFGELLNQKGKGSIKDREFRTLISRLKLFISMMLPIMPGEADILKLIGAEERNADFDKEIRILSKKAWKNLLMPKESLRHAAKECLEEERQAWKDTLFILSRIHSNENHKSLHELSDPCLNKYIESHDKGHEMFPPLSRRLDLRTRYLWRQYVRSKKTRDAYNVDSPKKVNDGIDFRIYTYLALPAFIVAEDGGFFGGIENIPSFQKEWIKKPDEIAEEWLNRTITLPKW